MRNGHLAVLVTALLFVRHLVFDLQRACARLDHLPGEQIGRLGIAEAGIDVGNDRNDMRLEIIDLRDQIGFAGLVSGLASSVERAENVVELAGIGLAQESVKLFDQRRHRGFFVHGLIGQRSEFGAKCGDHPA